MFKLFLIMIAIFSYPYLAFCQTPNELPPFYLTFFNEETIASILMIVGTVKLIRNLIKNQKWSKGIGGVIITLVTSLTYGIIQFGLGTHGIAYGLLVGLLAASVFFISKNIGTVVDKTDLTVDFSNIFENGFFKGLWKLVLFIAIRKNV